MQESLVSQGMDLMWYGMGVVFVFLTVLVILTVAMSSLVIRFFPEPIEPSRPKRMAKPPSSGVVEPRLVAVIQAAIHEHKAKHQKK